MRDYERELIAALAEGSLEDETEARALLDASSEARAEYQLQLAALEALSQASPVAMTESERAQLNREVWAGLRAEKAKTRSGAGIYGWSLAAAAIFVVVGLAAVLGGGILGGGDEALDAPSEATFAASDEASQESMEAGDADTFAEGDGAEAATPASSAESYFEDQADRLRQGALQRDLAADTVPEDDACLQMAGLTDHEVVAVLNEDGSAPIEGRHLAVVPSGEETGPQTPVHFVETETCEEVYTSIP